MKKFLLTAVIVSTFVSTTANSAEPLKSGDNKAFEWAKRNTWFTVDTEMSQYALSVAEDLERKKISYRSDEHYKRLDAALLKRYPLYFGGRITSREQYEHDLQCRGYGLLQGTKEYTDCRISVVDEKRIKAAQEASQRQLSEQRELQNQLMRAQIEREQKQMAVEAEREEKLYAERRRQAEADKHLRLLEMGLGNLRR